MSKINILIKNTEIGTIFESENINLSSLTDLNDNNSFASSSAVYNVNNKITDVEIEAKKKVDTENPTTFPLGIFEKSTTLTKNIIDVSTGTFFTYSPTGDTTFSIDGKPTVLGLAINFVLKIINGGSFILTWWDNISWEENVPPKLKPTGSTILSFMSFDSGATWIGFNLGDRS